MMNFKSTRSVDGKRFRGSAPFDRSFIKNLSVADDGALLFDYDLRDTLSGFPADVSHAYFAVTATDDNLLACATLHVEGDDTYVDEVIENYGDPLCGISCEVELAAEESKRILLFLLSEIARAKAARLN